MDSTPTKRSLRLTPRKSMPIFIEETPKKVRFSVRRRSTRSSFSVPKKSEDRVYSAEDALSMLNDSSLSDIETSSEEEWIVTKPKARNKLSDTSNKKEILSDLDEEANKPRKKDEVVSPLKLLRKPEYEVNKLPSACKKSESAVSPIIIKRKTDGKYDAAPSSSRKNNKKKSGDLVLMQEGEKKVKEKRRNKDLEKTIEDEIKDLHLETPKKNTPVYVAVSYRDVSVEYDEAVPYTTSTTIHSHAEAENKSKNTSQKVKTTRRAIHKSESADSDECDDLPSPPKRRSLRTSTLKQLPSSAPVQKSARKSSQKALLAILPNEENGNDIASPDGNKTPKRSINPQDSTPDLRRHVLTPKGSARKKLELPSPVPLKKASYGSLTPITSGKVCRSFSSTPRTPLEDIRFRLHTGRVPDSLPGREKEFETIFNFLSRRIEHKTGGCMYISGLPGTGKTATVNAVVKSLKKESLLGDLRKFDYIELNGLRLSEPRQAYVSIWNSLTGQKLSGQSSMLALEEWFNRGGHNPCVILIDELDYLCDKRQDVIYNILDWSTKDTARLIVLTIANTMDLAERTLKGKINSRMGLHKLPFQAYTFKQLETIVVTRLQNTLYFHPDAIEFAARKVAAISGDARRALDICRRAIELVMDTGEAITVTHINKVMDQIFSGTRARVIRHCSAMEKKVLRAILAELKRTGIEETTVEQIYIQLDSVCAFDDSPTERPVIGVLQSILTSLGHSGLLLVESARADIYRKVSLNVSEDDIHYAITNSHRI